MGEDEIEDEILGEDRVLGQVDAVAMEVGKVGINEPEDRGIMLEGIDDSDGEVSELVIVGVCALLLEAIVETYDRVAVRVPCVIGRALLMSLQSS